MLPVELFFHIKSFFPLWLFVQSSSAPQKTRKKHNGKTVTEVNRFPAEGLSLELLEIHLHKPTWCCGGGTFQVPGDMDPQQSAIDSVYVEKEYKPNCCSTKDLPAGVWGGSISAQQPTVLLAGKPLAVHWMCGIFHNPILPKRNASFF